MKDEIRNSELAVFVTTLQKTHVWLREIMERMGWQDPHRAYIALRAVLHGLRDRLPKGSAIQLGVQLPVLISGIYYEGWRTRGPRLKKADFLPKIARSFIFDGNVDPEKIARAVFSVIAKHVIEGELDDIRHRLPRDIENYWPPEVREAA